MTVADMVALFRSGNVPDAFYVTDGGLGAGECVGLEQDAGKWTVYYSEHGQKSPLSVHESEDSAARAMVARVGGMMRQSGLPPLPGRPSDVIPTARSDESWS